MTKKTSTSLLQIFCLFDCTEFFSFLFLFIFYNIYKKGKLEYYYKYVTKRPSPQKIQEIQFCNDVVFACLKEFNEWRDLLFFFYDIINAKVRLGGPKCWKDTSLFFRRLFQCTVVKNAKWSLTIFFSYFVCS